MIYYFKLSHHTTECQLLFLTWTFLSYQIPWSDQCLKVVDNIICDWRLVCLPHPFCCLKLLPVNQILGKVYWLSGHLCQFSYIASSVRLSLWIKGECHNYLSCYIFILQYSWYPSFQFQITCLCSKKHFHQPYRYKGLWK